MGNKNDDPARKQVDTQDAVRFGESVGVRVFETSAKENINVEEVTSMLFHMKSTPGHVRHLLYFLYGLFSHLIPFKIQFKVRLWEYFLIHNDRFFIV